MGEAGAPHRRERACPLALCLSVPGGPVCLGPRRAPLLTVQGLRPQEATWVATPHIWETMPAHAVAHFALP